MPKRRKVDHSRMDPLEVIIDLCFKEDTLDEFLTYLMEWVKQRKDSIHLCCRKLKVFAIPIEKLKKLLKMVHLHCIQELDMSCSWKQPVLGSFAPHLGQMVNLHRLLLSHVCEPLCSCPTEEDHHVTQFTSQTFRLHLLQELYLDSVYFLKGHLYQVLRFLMSPLETLSLTYCQLQESGLMLTGHLKQLDLCGVFMLYMSPEPLIVLLEKVSATLQTLDLDECGLKDVHFNVMLPALGRCSQLKSISFCTNPISMPVLENLLWNTSRLRCLHLSFYLAGLESYQGLHGTVHLGRFAELHARLKAILQDLEQTGMLLLSGHLCSQCGYRTFYDPEPIHCSCHRRA